MAYTESSAPILGIVVVGGLVALSRWVFSTRERDRRTERQRRDHGLLVSVSVPPGLESAQAVAARLLAAGIRATVGPASGPDHGTPVRVSADGRVLPRDDRPFVGHQVLVWPADAERARQLLSG